MRRREFISLLGAAAAWPLSARAQQGERVKRLGVLWGLAENDNVYEPHLSAFQQRLKDLGWIDGRNIRVVYRFTGGVTERIGIAAQELAALAPDVIFATTNPAVAPGSNVTLAPLTRAGSGALNSGSMRTVPVNHSAGPLPDGCVPFRLMSIALVLRWLVACP